MQQQRMSIAEWSMRMVMMMMMSTVFFSMLWVLYAGAASIWPQPIQSKAAETVMPPIFMILQVTAVVAVTAASPATTAAVIWNARMPLQAMRLLETRSNFFLLSQSAICCIVQWCVHHWCGIWDQHDGMEKPNNNTSTWPSHDHHHCCLIVIIIVMRIECNTCQFGGIFHW